MPTLSKVLLRQQHPIECCTLRKACAGSGRSTMLAVHGSVAADTPYRHTLGLLLLLLLPTCHAPQPYVDAVINQGWRAGRVAAHVPGAPLARIAHQAAGSSSISSSMVQVQAVGKLLVALTPHDFEAVTV